MKKLLVFSLFFLFATSTFASSVILTSTGLHQRTLGIREFEVAVALNPFPVMTILDVSMGVFKDFEAGVLAGGLFSFEEPQLYLNYAILPEMGAGIGLIIGAEVVEKESLYSFNVGKYFPEFKLHGSCTYHNVNNDFTVKLHKQLDFGSNLPKTILRVAFSTDEQRSMELGMNLQLASATSLELSMLGRETFTVGVGIRHQSTF